MSKLPKITLGAYDDDSPCQVDLEALMESNLLLQANSGGGKSWGLRRIVEQIHIRTAGKLPVVVIDPEGEFSTLRQNFDFLLIGPEGETPADPRTAALLAHRLLELRVSAVVDLYELPWPQRKLWVANFMGSMVNAPKHLWNDIAIAIDEIHDFAPESGKESSRTKGERSPATGPLAEAASKGRKRGQMLIGATQRLGKFSKDVAAELKNAFVGQTWMDIDRERAERALGIGKEGHRQFQQALMDLEPGSFFARGGAVTKAPRRMAFGPIETEHPRRGHRRVVAPPPTAKIVHLLPKLGDLPKEAEQKLKTEGELRAEVARLQRELQQAAGTGPRVEVQQVVPRGLEDAIKKAQDGLVALDNDVRAVAERRFPKIMESFADAFGMIVGTIAVKRMDPVKGVAAAGKLLRAKVAEKKNGIVIPVAAGDVGEKPSGSVLRILGAIRSASMDGGSATRGQIAALLAIRTKGTTLGSYISRARTGGYVTDEDAEGRLALTPKGRHWAPADAVPATGAELVAFWNRKLNVQQQRMLAAAMAVGPEGLISRDDLAAATYDERTDGPLPASGTTFGSYLSRMRTASILLEPTKGQFRAAGEFFR